jgi:hypothetical protein
MHFLSFFSRYLSLSSLHEEGVVDKLRLAKGGGLAAIA